MLFRPKVHPLNSSVSVRAQFDLPIARFDTDGEMRDKKMREVMDSDRVPYVSLYLDSVRPSCDPASFAATQSCPANTELPSRDCGAIDD